MDDTPPNGHDEVPEPLPPGMLVGMALAFEGGLGVLAWILSIFFGSPPLSDFRWDARDGVVGTVATIPMLAVFMCCLHCPVGPLVRIKQITEEVIGQLFGRCSITQLALISAVAGIGEEMLFRGFLQAALGLRYGEWLGLGIASLLFGMMHLITPTYAVLATILGAYLGGLWLWSGNLLAPIIAHALYDFIALAYLTHMRRR